MTQIDDAIKQDVDLEENKKNYANQKVTDVASTHYINELD